jgi:DNA-binding response OmpR family regulator
VKARVLIVEDEARIRDLVCLHLSSEGYTCVSAADGRQALQLAKDHPFDLVVLDLMLPGVDGLSVCRAIRREGINRDVPILMLTARREESDKVRGFESGADDYLTKPFGMKELAARVGALTHRRRGSSSHQAPAPRPPLAVKSLLLDPSRLALQLRGVAVPVTRHEFDLLYTLASNPGIVFTRERLLAEVWQRETFVTGRSVDTLVRRLRCKIEQNPSSPSLLLTVWGEGYKFTDG